MEPTKTNKGTGKADEAVNRLVATLASKNPPWVDYLNEAIELLREEFREELEAAVLACRDSILQQIPSHRIREDKKHESTDTE